MNSNEILSHVNNVRTSKLETTRKTSNVNNAIPVNNISDIGKNIAVTARNSLKNNDQIISKSITDAKNVELIDIVSSTNKTKRNVDIAVKIRDKIIGSWDKIMNMPM
ncbi:MAG TPA: flagellar hook-basal body complex protein FliE [Candidatus Megaira endosymbiont of Hartmannula sinica]|nr:flagellar hook-basal body complex protein FliE [Candidatus Megaera endosymbiont of Hartmannula sinica]